MVTEPFPDILSRMGEVIPLAGNRLLNVSGHRWVWFVAQGRADIFVVAPDGARDPFMSVPRGQLIFPLGGEVENDTRSLFRASGLPGTQLVAIALDDLRDRARDPDFASALVPIVDAWLISTATSVTRHVSPRPRVDLQVSANDETIELRTGQRLRASAAPCWISGQLDTLLFIGMETLDSQCGSIPLAPQSWVDAIGTGRFETHSTADLLANGGLWQGLAGLHDAMLACEQLNVQLAAVDEHNRLLFRREREALHQHHALSLLRAAVDGQEQALAPVAKREEAGRLWQIAALVAEASGLELRPPALRPQGEAAALTLSQLLAPSAVRARKVKLPPGWEGMALGPLIGWSAAEGAPVALLPASGARYKAQFSGTTAARTVDASLARGLRDDAVMLYRSLGDHAVSGFSLLRFGMRGSPRDILTLAAGIIATGLLGWFLPYCVVLLLDSVIPLGSLPLLWTLLAAMLATTLAVSASQIAQGTAILRLESRFDATTGAAVIDRLLRLPPTFFRRYASGDLGLRAVGLSAIRQQLSALLVNAVLPALSGLLSLGLLWILSPGLALAATLLVVTSMVVVLLLAKRHLEHQRRVQDHQGRLANLLLEMIANVAKLRVAAAEGMAFARWARLFAEQRQSAVASRLLSSRLGVWLSVLPAIAMLVVLAGASDMTVPDYSPGRLIAFQVALMQVVAALAVLCPTILAIVGTVPQFERMSVVLRALPEVPQQSHPPGQLAGGIEVSHVSFRYDPGGPLVLDDLSFRIEPGQFVAFVGASGCGKSTILRLLLGFETPERGTVAFDGQDLGKFDVTAIRRQMGVVLQHSRLIPGTIFNNIVGTAPLTLADAWEAARLARLDEDIQAMPMGMHSAAGEASGTLSGGQRQRLLIARALALRPRILLFDEATSALDNRTQADVMQSLEDLPVTRIAVAHRLSTVIRADCIYVMDAGRIVQQGRYEELIAQPGPFQDLVRRQQL